MKRVIVAVEENWWDNEALGIVVEPTDENSNIDSSTALREAALEFLKTEAGQKALGETCGHFNWGDVVEYLPVEICEKHGVRIVETFEVDRVVLHSEDLT